MVYLEAAIQGFSLKYQFSFRKQLENSCGGLISSKAACCISADFVEVVSFIDVTQVFCLFYYLFCERLFLGNFPWWLLHNFKYIFHFNVTQKESFLERTLRAWVFDKYRILHQLFIKNQLCVGNLERFPSQMTNLQTQ